MWKREVWFPEREVKQITGGMENWAYSEQYECRWDLSHSCLIHGKIAQCHPVLQMNDSVWHPLGMSHWIKVNCASTPHSQLEILQPAYIVVTFILVLVHLCSCWLISNRINHEVMSTDIFIAFSANDQVCCLPSRTTDRSVFWSERFLIWRPN